MSSRRLLGDVVLIVVGIGALVWGRIPLLVLMAGLAVLASGEVFRQSRATGVTPAAMVGLAGSLSLLVVAHLEGDDATLFFPIVIEGVVVLMFVAYLARRVRSDVTDGLALTVVPVVAIGMLAAYVVALRSGRDGFRTVLALTVMAVANDVVSGLVDPRRGKRALAPTVRPSRTWEGLAAGVVATMIAAVAVGVAFSETFSMGTVLVLGVLVSAAAPLGDLSRAMLERDLRAEASQAIARATVFRRIDGLLFSAPVFFYAFRLLER